MRTETVVCDGCGKDLTWTGNCEDYRLALVNEHIPSMGGFVTAMAAYPKIKRSAHFCSTACLRGWVDKDLPRTVDHYAEREYRSWFPSDAARKPT